MDKNYLLTYLKDNEHRYEWFDTEEEMQDFVDTCNVDKILDALEIFNAREINIEKN